MSDALKLSTLLYFNGTDGATSFTDDSVNGLTVTNNDVATAELDTAEKKFGSASCLMSLGASSVASDFTHEGTTRLTTSTVIYGLSAAPPGTEIYNAGQNAYSYVTSVVLDEITAGDPPTTAYMWKTTISPAIEGQGSGQTIYYAGTDVEIDNSGGELVLANDFSVSVWLKKGTCAGTFLDFGILKFKIESDETIKVTSLTTTLLTSTDTISTSTFTNVIIVRVGNLWGLYIDGVLQDTYTETGIFDYGETSIQVGNSWGGAGAGYAGWMDELQIWNGVSIVPSSFPAMITVATAEYTDDEDLNVVNLNLGTEITADDLNVAGLNLGVEVTGANLNVVSLNLSVEVLLPTGRLKYWDGAAWTQKPLKYWNGSAWEEKQLKYWNGSAWES